MGPDSLLISIDYDDTFTAAPSFWRDVIQHGQACGYRFICTSARRETFDNRREIETAMPEGVKVLLSYDQAKKDFAEKHGYHVDIWIDDIPEAVTSNC